MRSAGVRPSSTSNHGHGRRRRRRRKGRQPGRTWRLRCLGRSLTLTGALWRPLSRAVGRECGAGEGARGGGDRRWMLESSQSFQGMVGVCVSLEDRGGAIVRENKVMRGLGAGAGVCREVGVGSSWSWMEFGRMDPRVLLLPLRQGSLWIAAVHSAVQL